MGELHEACFDGSLPRVKAALAAGAELEAPNDRGRTAFYIAAINGRLAIMKLLAAAGAKVDACGDDGASALIGRVRFDCDLEATTFLLDHGANVNLATSSGWTALMMACHWDARWRPVTQLLIDRGADLNHRSKDGWTPLVLACAEGVWVERGVDQILIEAGADVNYAGGSGWTPLMMAVRFAKPMVVEDLIAHGAELDRQMVVGAATKPLDALAKRLNKKLEGPAAGSTALHWAVRAGKLSMVKLLDRAGADFAVQAADGSTAASISKGTVAKYIASRGGPPNKQTR